MFALVAFPSHCTHVLQPLDVAVYRPMKNRIHEGDSRVPHRKSAYPADQGTDGANDSPHFHQCISGSARWESIFGNWDLAIQQGCCVWNEAVDIVVNSSRDSGGTDHQSGQSRRDDDCAGPRIRSGHRDVAGWINGWICRNIVVRTSAVWFRYDWYSANCLLKIQVALGRRADAVLDEIFKMHKVIRKYRPSAILVLCRLSLQLRYKLVLGLFRYLLTIFLFFSQWQSTWWLLRTTSVTVLSLAKE